MIDLDSWTSIQFAPPIVSGSLWPARYNEGSKVDKWCKENCKGRAMIDNVVGDVCFELEQDAIMFSLRYL